MYHKIVILLLTLSIIGCKKSNDSSSVSEENKKDLKENSIQYAEGFKISEFKNYKTISITNPWPGADKTYTYVLSDSDIPKEDLPQHDAFIKTPITSIVVTSTTHIPSLEMLNAEETVVGFPNLNYISSIKTRKLITAGSIKEVGKNESLNTEVLIDLNPDAVVSFAVDGNNTTLSTIAKTGIPTLINADWTEKHPLGKAEWIKFFGALYNKSKEADSIFKTIETEYISAKKTAAAASIKPTVLSGAMFKDVWYMPQGDSWAAQFINDANGDYLWKESEGTGSISLNIESVLEKGQNANIWIGPGQFTSIEQLKDANNAYAYFEPIKTDNVYSFTTKKGETGGVIYYELAPNRPDIVLKDIIKILHPSLLPNHDLFFFEKLK
ncbi:ABC transporter substrate-binding protein [Patiriisocius marinistellae]|uniref:ABC transporter substrate-binding protein n=1 Tax=Patiriisocius marinistellae TaxID=2494560 RepID=A0A5J4FXD5_9FLAO|nr:ABC transporter substrate-binding protein [Patiriisocius marinistellae]GEQ85978.1 ABC transporter substrate-binding protein [Patiriisocius marinistellae]